jgi:tetratricopeptide (TPR) repeat protein
LLLADSGQGEKVEPMYREALSIREQLVADHPSVPDYLAALAHLRGDLSTLIEGLGKRSEAIVERRKAVAILEKLVADYPSVPEHRTLLVANYSRLGSHVYRRMLAVSERMVDEFPAVPTHREGVAVAHIKLGNVYYAAGKREDSERELRAALLIFEGLVRDTPGVPNYRLGLATSYYNLGGMLMQRGKWKEAEVEFRKAIEVIEKLATDHPDSHQYREQLKKISYDTACFSAMASTKFADKKTEYSDRTMELLQKAVKAGYNDAAHLKADTDLDPLRERKDFRKLLADLEAKFPPKREVLPAPRRE